MWGDLVDWLITNNKNKRSQKLGPFEFQTFMKLTMLKQKTLIAIMGNHNQGKTGTIKEIITLINLIPGAITVHSKVGKKI